MVSLWFPSPAAGVRFPHDLPVLMNSIKVIIGKRFMRVGDNGVHTINRGKVINRIKGPKMFMDAYLSV